MNIDALKSRQQSPLRLQNNRAFQPEKLQLLFIPKAPSCMYRTRIQLRFLLTISYVIEGMMKESCSVTLLARALALSNAVMMLLVLKEGDTDVYVVVHVPSLAGKDGHSSGRMIGRRKGTFLPQSAKWMRRRSGGRAGMAPAKVAYL